VPSKSQSRARRADAVPDPAGPTKEEVERAVAIHDYRIDDAAGYIIRRAHQRATACFQEIFKGVDVTPRQQGVILTLQRHGELSQNLLGRMTSMDPANIKGVISRLITAGLVERFANDADRRLGMLRLTPAGQALALDLLPRAHDVGEAILAPIPEEERARFIELLRLIG
jgi:DNA-binding MarR family transcriptional regulator